MPLHDLPCRLWWFLRFAVQPPSKLCSRLKTQNRTDRSARKVNHQRSGPTPNAPHSCVFIFTMAFIHRRHRSSILNQTT